MKKNTIISVKRCLSIFLCTLLIFAVFSVKAAADGKTHDKLRIGYCQAGEYYEFDYQIYQIGYALTEANDITCESFNDLKQGDSYDEVWKALSSCKSDYYEFGIDCCFDLTSPEFFGLSEEKMGEKLDKLINDKDIDLMITMGTVAGVMVKEYTEVPYMNFMASDPVSSGITKASDYSGDYRAWANVNEGIELRAVSVMYDLFTPQKVGIVYDGGNPDAYVYSGAVIVDDFAAEHGIEVIKEYVSDEFEDTDEAYKNYFDEMKAAHERLAGQGIDLYILTTSYLELEDFYDALHPFMEHNIPVFSINSTEDVRCGALAAVEMIDYQNIGRFAADNLKKYHDGVSLRDLQQQYATAPFLVLNIDTMHETGVKLSYETLISSSKIYGKYQGK